MKALLYSLMVMAMVGSVVGGGLFAYFSDTETSTGNTFTAGTIDIALSGDVGAPVHQGVSLDFKPCETGYLTFVITNVGKNPVKVWKHITNVASSDNGTNEPELEYYAQHPNDPRDLLPSDVDFSLTVNGVVKIPPGGPSLGKLLSEVVSRNIYLGEIPPGGTMTVEQDFHIRASVGNWAQSDVLSWDEIYTAQQMGAPAPPNELVP